ncbi:hypothetical protein SORBI_3001G184950 [Sorghum bicolor]|uniref:Uncharacterized protein n=1 Tax=Sorghum bicolor TaxID=4558 RepID=A0A1Z5S6A6_SORBI|nr:hypothetical protein SORBI_3001G184950 [Sorghum bicolor]
MYAGALLQTLAEAPRREPGRGSSNRRIADRSSPARLSARLFASRWKLDEGDGAGCECGRGGAGEAGGGERLGVIRVVVELCIISDEAVVLASQHFILVLVPTISYLQQIGTKNMVCSG